MNKFNIVVLLCAVVCGQQSENGTKSDELYILPKGENATSEVRNLIGVRHNSSSAGQFADSVSEVIPNPSGVKKIINNLSQGSISAPQNLDSAEQNTSSTGHIRDRESSSTAHISEDVKQNSVSVQQNVTNPGQIRVEVERNSDSGQPDKGSTIVPDTTVETEKELCTTEEGIAGKCVLYYQCDDVYDVDLTIALERKGWYDNPCSFYLDVCCINITKRVTPMPSFAPISNISIICGQLNVSSGEIPNKSFESNEDKFLSSPWMVTVNKVTAEDERGIYIAGGSLIHPSIILTAAHRVYNVSGLRVQTGQWESQSRNKTYEYQLRDVKEIVIHTDFNPRTLFNDISLLFLDQPFNLTSDVGVVCLPEARINANAGTRCQVWTRGRDSTAMEGQNEKVLKGIDVPVVDNKACLAHLRKTRLGNNFFLHSSFMCAGGEFDKDACKGDGGAPLICPIQNEEDRYEQSGIVSWGINCGQEGVPGVYTDVANFRDWIDEKVKGHGYDPIVYTY